MEVPPVNIKTMYRRWTSPISQWICAGWKKFIWNQRCEMNTIRTFRTGSLCVKNVYCRSEFGPKWPRTGNDGSRKTMKAFVIYLPNVSAMTPTSVISFVLLDWIPTSENLKIVYRNILLSKTGSSSLLSILLSCRHWIRDRTNKHLIHVLSLWRLKSLFYTDIIKPNIIMIKPPKSRSFELSNISDLI